MATDSDFTAARESDRVAAWVASNTATKCRRCSNKGVLDKRGLCFSCSEKRLASIHAAAIVPLAQVPKPDVTITSLLGNGGPVTVQGADLNHCTSAMTARANLAASFKDLGKYESHLIAYPNSAPAWESYERVYNRIEGVVRDIKLHEAAVKANHPELVVAPILIPQKLERAPTRDWLEV